MLFWKCPLKPSRGLRGPLQYICFTNVTKNVGKINIFDWKCHFLPKFGNSNQKNWNIFILLEGQNYTFIPKILFQPKFSYGRMIEISGRKHFRFHTRNAEKNFFVSPLLLVKNLQNWLILGPSDEGKVQSDGWSCFLFLSTSRCINTLFTANN